MVNNGYAPTTVDIAGLELDYLSFSNDTSGITLTGNDFRFNAILCLRGAAPRVTNTIQQNIEMTRMAPSIGAPSFAVAGNSALRLDGVLGATNPACGMYYSWNWGGSPSGITLLMNTNTFSKGIPSLYNRVTFFRDANLGVVPPTNVPAYISFVNGARLAGGTLGGFNKAVIHENRGLRISGQSWFVADNDVKLVHKGTLMDGGGTLTCFEQTTGNGVMVLSGSGTFSGGTTISGDGKHNVVVMDNDAAFGTVNLNNILTVASSFDLNGHALTTLRPSVYNNSGYYSSGTLRNNNPDTAAAIATEVRLGGSSAVLFGGRGDITLSGTIVPVTAAGPLVKSGAGAVTLKGETTTTNDVSVRAGSLVCDYTDSNTTKLSGTNRLLYVRGAAVSFIGNDSAPKTEEILDWSSLESGVPQGAAALSIASGDGQDFTLSARRLIAALGDSLDISLASNGGGVAAFTNALSPINNGVTNYGGALGGNVTFNKSTWASVVNGNVEGLPDGSFETDFAASTSDSHMDIAGDIDINSAAANTLRAKSAGATTLDIADGQTLSLGLSGGVRIPGILLTPDAGSVDINGGTVDIGLNNWLHVHNFSANRLTISSLIKLTTVNSRVMKCGPGEMELANAANTFSDLGVYGGTVLFDQIANAGQAQQLGAGQLYLGDATLKYTGAGHSTDRTIVLRGSGVIDASGSGPLAFTATKHFIANPSSSFNDMPLTLTGTGTGSIAGTMAFPGGYLTKSGSGLWILGSGYTNWETTVKAGTLQVNGTLLSWNVVDVNADGKLAGNAAVPRDLAVSGTLAPGASVGVLDAGYLTMNPGSVYEWEVDANNATADVIRVATGLELPENAANSVTVKVVQAGGASAISLPALLFSYLTGDTNALVVDTAGTGFTQPAVAVTDNGIFVSVVPEPAAMMVMALMLLGLRRAAQRVR